MKKQIYSMLMALCMIFVLLPTTAFAADTVGKVVLTVDAPKAGDAPATTASLPSTSSTCVKGVQWKGDFDDSGKFQTGKSYTVYILVGMREGKDKTFQINYASNITINGKEAKFQLQSKDELIAWYTFTLTAKTQVTPISTVDITITSPVAGNTADHAPVVLANGTSGLVNVMKTDWGGSFDGKLFKAGTGYTLSVRMEPAKKGYVFAKGITATVNGLAAEVIYRADSTMMVKYVYKPTAGEVAEAERSERFSIGTCYTMEEVEAIRTTERDGVLIGKSIDDLNALSQTEVRRLRKFVITGHDVGAAQILVARLGHVFDLFRVNEVWIGPEYTGAEAAEIIKAEEYDNRFSTDAICSGHMQSNDSRYYISEATLTTFDTEMYGRNVRVYKGDDVAAAAQRGAADTRNWCTNHTFIGATFDAGTVYTYNDCSHIARFYRVCGDCGECERNPNQTVEWVVNNVRHTSGGPIHDFQNRVVDSAYVGTDVNGQKVYYRSCSICGQITEACPANLVQKALNGEAIVSMFRVSQTVTAKTSAGAQSEINETLQEGLVDMSLLGDDYTKDCTRLQLCSMAVKLAEKMTGKVIPPAPASTFTDTQNEYALKACAAGIIGGTTETTFSPEQTLTRQEMAAFLYRALQYVKANSDIRYTPYTSRLDSYTDSGQLQGWAVEPMAFMDALGLITGISATTLSPNNNCTIEEALIVANRSLNAHKIGWYIVRTDKELRDSWFGYCTFYTTAGAKTYYNYVPGEVIWMTDWRNSNGIGGDLITVEPYTGVEVKATGSNFVPIREK